MDILCLMGLYPNEYIKEIEKNAIVGLQNAANKLQWGFIEGLESIGNVDITILNSIFIGSYPYKYKKANIPSFTFKHNTNALDKNIGFMNIMGIKYISKYLKLKKEVDKWLLEHTDGVIIAYAMTSPFVELLYYIKKSRADIPVFLIVPDLPEYMDMSKKRFHLYQFLKKIQIKSFKKKITCIDGFVLLTEQMKEWFENEIEYVVVEGIAKIDDIDDKPKDENSHNKTIMYSGSLAEKYGVVDLANAFNKIEKKDWKLIFYGDGDALPKLEKIAKVDNRIKLKGVIPNEQIVKIQKNAGLLVNPRKDIEEFTKYSFPSKLIEYMNSGTPVLAYSLKGVPNEYNNYFYKIDESENGLQHSLLKIMQLSEEERTQFGNKARDFIRKYKNPNIQCSKVMKLIKKCSKNI